MKIFSTMLMILLLCGCLYAQDKTESNDTTFNFVIGHDDCGNPAVESQLYDLRKGRITKILSANKVLFEQTSVNGNEKKDSFSINIVGIDANANKSILKSKLQDVLLNQEVEITGNLRKKTDKKYGGTIWLLGDNEDIDEVNEYLLENGIAKYKSFESNNLVSMVMPCRLEKAEQRAKDAKLGFWKNNPGGFFLGGGECGGSGGSPSRWDNIRGKVVSVIDSDTLIIQAENKAYTIDLIGIDASKNEAKVILFLQKTILEKRVIVSVKWKTGNKQENSGTIDAIDENKKINEYLLKYGMAAYKKINYEDLDDGEVTDCRYLKLEAKAKEAKLGIWAK